MSHRPCCPDSVPVFLQRFDRVTCAKRNANPRYYDRGHVVYSGLLVADDGTVTPLVLVRQVGHPGYGGDYCEFVDGAWRQLGLVPNPNALPSKEYIAKPLDLDTSFDPKEYRDEHEEGFRRWAAQLGE